MYYSRVYEPFVISFVTEVNNLPKAGAAVAAVVVIFSAKVSAAAAAVIACVGVGGGGGGEWGVALNH